MGYMPDSWQRQRSSPLPETMSASAAASIQTGTEDNPTYVIMQNQKGKNPGKFQFKCVFEEMLASEVLWVLIGGLSNHGDDGNKNVTNLHIWQCMLCTRSGFARAFLIFGHFADVLVLSTTWNDLFCSCVDDVSIWWPNFNFVFWSPKRWFQFNSRIVRAHLQA